MGQPAHKPSSWSGEALDRAFERGTPEYIFYLMLQATRRREFLQGEHLRALGLTVPKWRAMAVISRCGACAMTEVAHLSAVDRTTLTRTVDQLVEEGLVERMASPDDRRVTLLKLSAAGVALIERARAINFRDTRTLLAGVPDDQRVTMIRVLQQIVDNLIDDDDVAYGVLTFNRTSMLSPER